MKKRIGIVSEGPTDRLVISAVVDAISGEENDYLPIQPQPNCAGEYGNGWKGVWKWCLNNHDRLSMFFSELQPSIHALIIHMDGDVSRKEKEPHCLCPTTICNEKGKTAPIYCPMIANKSCPISLPCLSHTDTPDAYREHLTDLIGGMLCPLDERVVITIPCDSTEAWVVAAYDDGDDPEMIHDPWKTIISKRKTYHDIRIHGDKKHVRDYRNLTPQLVKTGPP